MWQSGKQTHKNIKIHKNMNLLKGIGHVGQPRGWTTGVISVHQSKLPSSPTTASYPNHMGINSKSQCFSCTQIHSPHPSPLPTQTIQGAVLELRGSKNLCEGGGWWWWCGGMSYNIIHRYTHNRTSFRSFLLHKTP